MELIKLSENVNLENGIMNEYTITRKVQKLNLLGMPIEDQFVNETKAVITEYNDWIEVHWSGEDEDKIFEMDKIYLKDFLTIFKHILNED